MKRLLLHTCCAPCLSAPWQHLRDSFKTTAFFYNPNIQPYQEFKLRLNCLREYSKTYKIPLIIDKAYTPEKFAAGCLANEFRCRYCYELRLRQTAMVAKANNFEAFSTTLFISPYQNHEMLKTIGTDIADELGIELYYQDMRPLFVQSRELSITDNLYRQGYCGCIFSERDRYQKQINKAGDKYETYNISANSIVYVPNSCSGSSTD